MTHVTFENISFNSYVVINTKGLVTMQGCTLQTYIAFFIHKSEQEADFTYKTAEMIPSVINNRTINFINTSFHIELKIYLLSRIRTINIVNCEFVKYLSFVTGNKSTETETRHLTVLNISIIKTRFTNYFINYWPYGRDSIISLKVMNSVFNSSNMVQIKGAGYFGAVLEDSKFHGSIIRFEQAISVVMRNCKYDVSDKIYDNFNTIVNDRFKYEPLGIRKAIKLLICPESHCENYLSTVSIENTVFTGILNKQTDSVTKIYNANLIMRNVTFNIHQEDNKHYINSLYNMTINKSTVHCKVCPLGANCTGSIKALPKYWGYKNSLDDSVTMIRCPNEYCCKGNDTCNEINSCNKNRTGSICGKCQNGLSEALFSTDCIPDDTCMGTIVILYYTICVTIYILFLTTYKDLQKLSTAKITELYKK